MVQLMANRISPVPEHDSLHTPRTTKGELQVNHGSPRAGELLREYRRRTYASMRLVEDTGAVAIPQPHTYVAVADDKRCRTDDTNKIRFQHNMHNA